MGVQDANVTIHFNPVRQGLTHLHVHVNDKPINQSPIELDVQSNNEPSDWTLLELQKPPATYTIGGVQPIKFEVLTRDRFANSIEINQPGSVEVRLSDR